MKNKIFILVLFTLLISLPNHLYSEDFDLFETEEVENPKMFTFYQRNVIKTTYAIFPFDSKKGGLSYEYFFKKKIAGFFEGLYHFGELDEEIDDDLKNRIELNLGVTYRITKRVKDLMFLATAGLSLDNSTNTFTVNQLFGRLDIQYIFDNGFGVAYSLRGRMPFRLTEENNHIEDNHLISVLFQF